MFAKYQITGLAGLTLSLLAVGCGLFVTDSDVVTLAHDTTASADGLAVFDDTIPDLTTTAYELLHHDLEEITRDSSVIFVGRVVGYRERVIVAPWDDEAFGRMLQDVTDGIVMEADEVLLGEIPDSTLTLGAGTLTEEVDGAPVSRNTRREVHLFKDGIMSLGSDGAPRYLVYAVPASEGSEAAEIGLYWINTRGGVVRVFDDDSLSEGLSSPFAEVWRPGQGGQNQWVLPYDLQDARDAAVLAKGGIEDTTGPPEEQTPGLDEGPVEQSGDGSDGVDPGDGGTPATDGGETDKEDVGSDAGGTSDSGEVGETPGGDGGGDGSGSGEPSGQESSGGDVGGRDAGDPVGQEDGGLGAGSRDG